LFRKASLSSPNESIILRPISLQFMNKSEKSEILKILANSKITEIPRIFIKKGIKRSNTIIQNPRNFQKLRFKINSEKRNS